MPGLARSASDGHLQQRTRRRNVQGEQQEDAARGSTMGMEVGASNRWAASINSASKLRSTYAQKMRDAQLLKLRKLGKGAAERAERIAVEIAMMEGRVEGGRKEGRREVDGRARGVVLPLVGR
eukprot:3408047-Rhodomonas_salina.2